MINLAGGAVISSFALFLLVRYRGKMTSLLTWIVGSLRSQQVISSTSNEDNKTETSQNNKNKSQSKGGKGHQKSKQSNEDPTFSTSLATPIEDIIEETINDEVKSVNKKKGKPTKTASKSEESSKKTKSKQDPVDSIGYSFFNVKTVNKVNSEPKSKKQSSVDLTEDNQTDDVGFSFLPVKEKGKKYKHKSNSENKHQELTLSAVLDQAIRKSKHEVSKPSVIDHYQKRRGNEKFSPKKSATKAEKPQTSVSSIIEKRLLYENQLKSEPKESKKVSSNISYASIVVNSVSEIPSNSGCSDTVDISLEPDSSATVKPTIDYTGSLTEDAQKSTQKHISNSINLTESNSSSIEVLNETSTESQQTVEEVTNFEFIEKKLNTLLNDDTDFEQVKSNLVVTKVRDHSSKHSSICIIDNQEEFEETQDFISNTEHLTNIDVRFDRKSEYISNSEQINTLVSDSIVNSEEHIQKNTSSEVFLSFNKEVTTELENTNSSYTFETNNYFESEAPQSNDYSQFGFERNVQNYSLENISEVTQSYAFAQNYIQTENNGNLSDGFSGVEHSFTELLRNSYSTDPKHNYYQPEKVSSVFPEQFHEGHTAEEHLDSREHYILESEPSGQQYFLQEVEASIATNQGEVVDQFDRDESEPLEEQYFLQEVEASTATDQEEVVDQFDKNESEPSEQQYFLQEVEASIVTNQEVVDQLDGDESEPLEEQYFLQEVEASTATDQEEGVDQFDGNESEPSEQQYFLQEVEASIATDQEVVDQLNGDESIPSKQQYFLQEVEASIVTDQEVVVDQLDGNGQTCEVDQDVHSDAVKEDHPVDKSQFEPELPVTEPPFIKTSAYTVGTESQNFIDEEKSEYNLQEKAVNDSQKQLEQFSFAGLEAEENRSEGEEEEHFTYVLAIDDRNQLEAEESKEINGDERNQFIKEDLSTIEEDNQLNLNQNHLDVNRESQSSKQNPIKDEESDQDFVYVQSVSEDPQSTVQQRIQFFENDKAATKERDIKRYNSFTEEGETEPENGTRNQKSAKLVKEATVTQAQIEKASADESGKPTGETEREVYFEKENIQKESFIQKSTAQHSHRSVIEKDQLIPENMPQIRVLTLNDHEHQESTLYRIEKNWVIQFRIGPSLFGRKVFLYCNYPSKGTEFSRNKYFLLEWGTDEGCENADDTALFTEIKAEAAGSFHYYITYDKGENLERHASGYFLVDPVLKYGNNEDLPLDCIQCQTVLAKCLGSFSSWEKKLQVTKESGYNMIHFTPIQELGESNSSYSLSEQLKLNTVFRKSDGKMPTFEEIERFTTKLRKEWKVTSICDIVLNHTANESKWIQEHPEVTYNCVNCPYMRPAYLIDAAYDFFSSEVKKGVYEDRGIPTEVNNEDHLNAIRYHFRASILDPLKIYEMFTCDTSKCVAEFLTLARNTEPTSQDSRSENDELELIQDPEYRRLATSVDMKLALKLYNVYWNDTFDDDSRLKKCAEQFKNKLDELNNRQIDLINDHLTAGVENVIAGIRYFRVQHDGPKFTDITIKTPLVYRYFTDYGSPKTLKEFEDIMYSDNGRFLMAHNGWVMNSDPLRNFAAADSKVYLRRELIAWGDSVKLRFGDKPEDCPFLWDYMKQYVEQTARIFDGVRLDNCHSTPLPVAEYLLDCARKVRPNLYVAAELFTNSDMTDNIFVNRLGITSLIREAMSAWDSHEEGRLVYRYGGSPVGSFHQPNIRPLVPSIAHALFLDQTHDNPSPVEKRSVFDLLPSTALVNMACCASGSNRGYDELVPHHIHVVDEDREYTEWTNEENLSMGNLRYVTHKSGIIKAKRAINDLHFLLGKEGFNQVYVDQMDPDIVAVTRHCPVTHQSYILVAFTAFGHPNEDAGNYQRGIKSLRFEGVLEEIVIEATLSHVKHNKSGGSKFTKSKKFVKDSKWINGHPEYTVTVKEHIQISESDVFEKVDSGSQNVTQLNFKDFKPGSIVVVKASLPETMRAAVKTVRHLIGSISLAKDTELSKIVNKMKLSDMNRALYRCDQEERDEGFGFDTYNIPNFGSMVYAGLQGVMSLLANIRPNNDLGHPMCANLRDGNWMIDYIWKRLKLDPGTQELGEWLERNTQSFANIPRYLVPCYFDIIITGVYLVLIEKSHKLMSNFVEHGSTFVKGLALGSLQFGGYIKSADLPTLSPNLEPPKPPTRKNDKNETVQACVTLSAGLPHFAVGYMRNWGRDTFIAMRGLFILTGRYQEAREHILGYAACLRHGLIPNLLDGGRNSRFNCRDAIWWWLYCIKEYVNATPEGIKILSDKVSRIFPTDDAQNQPPGAVDQPLHDVIQEGLKIHFQGLAFRERNAGKQIDEHMVDQGFNNQIGIHPETGFVFGGNKWNCGTWMDKMGSSDKAGNRGKPATPRDGSAIELIGLSKSVISWLARLSDEHKYPYKGVERTHKSGKTTHWTFKEWAALIQSNFEKHFWVNSKPTEGEIRPDLINKRGIYKDSYGSSNEYTDFQLRCNFPIAMVAAPELFTPSRAWEALNQAEKYLLGPLGMKTLDPDDWAYRGDYDNSNQSDDGSVANGFNYHQGPEWVWPIGFFLRAKLIFAAQNGALKETLASTKLILSKHFVELQTSDWRGLPELTNSNGSYCRDSSRTQAWSMSCVLEVLYDLKKIESSVDLLDN